MKAIINLGGELVDVDEKFFERITIVEEKEIGDTVFICFISGDDRHKHHFSVYKNIYLSLKREMKINKLI